MSTLRKKMQQDMSIRGLAKKTQQTYIAKMRDFAVHFKQSPDKLSVKEIQAYQYYLKEERNISWSGLNQFVCAARFFYTITLGQEWLIKHIPYHRKQKRLPTVLSRQELSILFAATRNIKHRTLMMTLYSGGMRVNEAVHLKREDLDNDRQQIHIRNGKGGKERYTLFSRQLAEQLERYYRCRYDTSHWLFPGMFPERHLCVNSIQKVFQEIVPSTGIRKHVTPHTLRHSFATHLMETGASMPVLQQLLGHRSLASTMIYTHVSQKQLNRIASPLDTLESALAMEEVQ